MLLVLGHCGIGGGSTDLDGWDSDGAASSARLHTQCACPTTKRNQKERKKKKEKISSRTIRAPILLLNVWTVQH